MKERQLKDWSKATIIILNYNRWIDTIECLESVLRNSYPNYNVVVIDNNSPNNSMEYIKTWAEGKLDTWIKPDNPLRYLSYPPVKKPIPYVFYTRKEAEKGGNVEKEKKLEDIISQNNAITTKYPLVLIQTGDNLGFVGGNNVGIRYILAKGNYEYIWLLNNDTVIDKDSLRYLISETKLNDRVDVVGSIILDYTNPQLIREIGGGKIYKILGLVGIIRSIKKRKIYNETFNRCQRLKIDYVSGCSLLILIKVIEEVGLMGEEYFLYWEDADWCKRIKISGYTIGYSNMSKIWHKKGLSSSQYIRAYYNRRNSLIFFKKFYPKYLFYLQVILNPIISILIGIKNMDIHYIKGALRGYVYFLRLR